MAQYLNRIPEEEAIQILAPVQVEGEAANGSELAPVLEPVPPPKRAVKRKRNPVTQRPPTNERANGTESFCVDLSWASNPAVAVPRFVREALQLGGDLWDLGKR